MNELLSVFETAGGGGGVSQVHMCCQNFCLSKVGGVVKST